MLTLNKSKTNHIVKTVTKKKRPTSLLEVETKSKRLVRYLSKQVNKTTLTPMFKR